MVPYIFFFLFFSMEVHLSIRFLRPLLFPLLSLVSLLHKMIQSTSGLPLPLSSSNQGKSHRGNDLAWHGKQDTYPDRLWYLAV
ncbi:hypothetical protein F5884DRAFT_230988 [Xylogone sp. PMI_703]|nr:hypothetical protein F5884DRAFT_230988 [Xylogone sp. PMI_703]